MMRKCIVEGQHVPLVDGLGPQFNLQFLLSFALQSNLESDDLRFRRGAKHRAVFIDNIVVCGLVSLIHHCHLLDFPSLLSAYQLCCYNTYVHPAAPPLTRGKRMNLLSSVLELAIG